jgi:nucleoside permease NupC
MKEYLIVALLCAYPAGLLVGWLISTDTKKKRAMKESGK